MCSVAEILRKLTEVRKMRIQNPHNNPEHIQAMEAYKALDEIKEKFSNFCSKLLVEDAVDEAIINSVHRGLRQIGLLLPPTE